MTQPGPSPLLDLVIPVYNEADCLEAFHRQLQAALESCPGSQRIYYVDDGSKDATPTVLAEIASSDPCVTVVRLSRNFGHQAALSAGLKVAQGDAVITMDGDGEHPPEKIPEMVALFLSGYDVVQTQRLPEGSSPDFKQSSGSLFYWLISRVSETTVLPGTADFRLLSRKAVEALNSMPERHRFLRGMVPWMGFKTVLLPYLPQQRLAGKTKYTLRKMLRLAYHAIFSFSTFPIYVALATGGIFLALALAEAIYVLSFWLRGEQHLLAPGWSSLMFMILIVGSIVLFNLGMIGIYIGYIFQEVKQRPLFLIESITNPPPEPPSA